VNETILKTIATYPDEDYFFVTNFRGLTAIRDRLITQACRTISTTRDLPTTLPYCDDDVQTQPPIERNAKHNRSHTEINYDTYQVFRQAFRKLTKTACYTNIV